jgi:putative membrane protein insertion efficiency factor
MIQAMLIGVVKAYRLLLSPWLGSACRFEPTCSAYSLQALQTHGSAAGTYLTLKRLARCQPWCAGGHDPIPLEKPRLTFQLFTQLFHSSTQKKSS